MISTGTDICRNFDETSSREWVETNGIGGYAMGTVSGAHTRRYHGLLIAATRPPLGRMLLLSKFEEAVLIGGERFELSSNRYPGAVDPKGYLLIKDFCLDPFPIWTYEIDGVEIEKRVFMVDSENTTVCHWTCSQEATLELRPLLAFRDHHQLRREDANFDTSFVTENGSVTFTPYGEMPSLRLSGNFREVERTGVWYRNFEYAIEQERGFDSHEDLYQPCVLTFDMAEPAEIIASTADTSGNAAELQKKEMRRRALLVATAKAKDEQVQALVLAADQFIVKRGDGKTVIAGYPWFSDWGRDTMIALPGLTLSTGRPAIAKQILTEFSQHISEGMIPNRFPDAGETPEYNTADATLWFFEAIRAYVEATGDLVFVRETLYDKLTDIVDWHVSGTRYGIKLDNDGFLNAGLPGTQLTWMDAKVGDVVFTPRIGKPVEIQALWYNALLTLADLADEFGDAARSAHYRAMAAKARLNFEPLFWNEAEQCLFDVVDGDDRDASVSPNQIFAVSLHHAIVEGDLARAIVDKVEAELLTPVGLRSLSPRDAKYIGTYRGSPFERDSSYHQGTVWGWLTGPFVSAYRKVHGGSDPRGLAGLDRLLTTSMMGQVAEIFDGDPPHTAHGCPAQAWSVAELLRVHK